MHYEAAEMLNLTMEEIQWLVNTGQIHEITIRGNKRLDERDVDRLLTFCKRVQERNKHHHAGYRSIQIPER